MHYAQNDQGEVHFDSCDLSATSASSTTSTSWKKCFKQCCGIAAYLDYPVASEEAIDYCNGLKGDSTELSHLMIASITCSIVVLVVICVVCCCRCYRSERHSSVLERVRDRYSMPEMPEPNREIDNEKYKPRKDQQKVSWS